MAQNERKVKQESAGNNGLGDRCRMTFFEWIEAHPRTGWYIAVFGAINVILNFLDAFDLF